MKRNWAAAASAALIVAFAAPVVAQADSISSVENARAKARAGYYLDRQDREQLRRYGGNDGYRWRGYRDYGYYDDYYGGPGGVSVYVGPGGVGVYGY